VVEKSTEELDKGTEKRKHIMRPYSRRNME
jgi:hypothetical protein